nr:DUF485 domain-containing protein [Nocardiopsis mwathae]
MEGRPGKVPEEGEVERFRSRECRDGGNSAGAAGGSASAVFASWDPQFVTLRRRSIALMAILVTLVLGWYLGYLFMSAYQRDVMGHQLVGWVNVALIAGVGQFVSTFALAWAYGRYSRRHLDPLAERIRAGSRREGADLRTAFGGKAEHL